LDEKKKYIFMAFILLTCTFPHRFFLNALEKGSYGWKWMCQNGLDCHYRHCLPPGYILKKDLKKEGDEELQRIEDLID